MACMCYVFNIWFSFLFRSGKKERRIKSFAITCCCCCCYYIDACGYDSMWYHCENGKMCVSMPARLNQQKILYKIEEKDRGKSKKNKNIYRILKTYWIEICYSFGVLSHLRTNLTNKHSVFVRCIRKFVDSYSWYEYASKMSLISFGSALGWC